MPNSTIALPQQFYHAWKNVGEEYMKAWREKDRLNLVQECILHIRRGERPFTHRFTDYDHHKGDPFERTEIVWAVAKPVSSTDDESYTLLDMPEYEDAMHRILTASTEPIPA